MGTALLHRVLGTQGEDSQVLQRQQQFDKSQVQLLGKDLAHLVALILQVEEKGMREKIIGRNFRKVLFYSCDVMQ